MKDLLIDLVIVATIALASILVLSAVYAVIPEPPLWVVGKAPYMECTTDADCCEKYPNIMSGYCQ